MLDASQPALTAGQRAFCTEATLLRYLAYHDKQSDKQADPTGAKTASKAHAALQATLKWRGAQGFDPDPADKVPRRCEQCEQDPNSHCFFSIGLDKRGWEVIYCCPPRSRLKDPASSSAHAFKCFEAVADRAPGGVGTGKFLMCVDLHGLGFSDLNPATAMMTTTAILSHYVGQIGQICILDAPFTFKGLWAMISGMLDAVNAAKIQMLRGEAMTSYFTAYFTEPQAQYMREVLQMKAVPGSLPACTQALRMPLDGGSTPCSAHGRNNSSSQLEGSEQVRG